MAHPWLLKALDENEADSKMPLMEGGGGAISESLCKRFQRAGVRMWGAGAYKCATDDLFHSDLPDSEHRLTNVLDWGAYAKKFALVGLVSTAWSRNTTDAPQYVPIDAALDLLVATGLIWKEGLATQKKRADTDKILHLAKKRALTLIKKQGQAELFAVSQDLMARLTRSRFSGWRNAVQLREQSPVWKADPRRKSFVCPEKMLGYLLGDLQQTEQVIGPQVLSHFETLVPRLWMERYLSERVEPLRQEYEDLKQRMGKMFPNRSAT